ncbi:MAG: CapA family protein [Bacilli bacterium]|nr:CapA family protein [Bacilli bacterium]
MKKVYIILSLIIINLILVVITSFSFGSMFLKSNNIISKKTTTKFITEVINNTTVNISAIGDCTIGYDDNFGYTNSFNEVLNKNGYEYFFSNVKNVIGYDDITVANLEGTFTDYNQKREKAFNFKGPKDYVKVLTKGSIEVVNLANNHTYDYGDIGYNDTVNTLNESNVSYFGYDNYYVFKKDDVNIGFAGIFCIENRNCTTKIDKAIENLRERNVDTIILSFHWGIEKSYRQSSIQTYLAHYAIDSGVELVLGHHPHVLQGIELYNDKYIVYSLANFSFGGNKNPGDKDTMIFNIKFKYQNKKIVDTIVNVYPTRVSSVNNINDYRPTILDGEEANRVLKKIEKNSIGVTLT